MFGKIILKMLFKVSIPLLILAGVLNYGVYLRGGDPFAMWKGIGANMFSGMQDSASNTMNSLNDFKFDLENVGNSDSFTKVYSWKDENGQTHYSSVKPEGVQSQLRGFDPDANVLMAFKVPPKKEKKKPEPSAQASVQPSPPVQKPAPSAEASLPELQGIDPAELSQILKNRQKMLDSL